MGKKLTSVFTDNMDVCIFTKSNVVERHHIIGKTRRNKELCEEYGFIVPLRPDLHPNGASADDRYREQIDNYLKKMAQEYFEAHYGDREEWMRLFDRNYLD